MCGICGVVGPAAHGVIDTMTTILAHRGPDGDGVRRFPGGPSAPPVALGHRRLSIIDPTDRGAQPMSYEDGRYWITYNGELYNFRGLRDTLERNGYRFASDCDTEVLLAMYARDGEGMLDHLNGDFAFAIWDTEAATLFLARDRLGVKPLYYATHGDSLVFGSEIKAVLPALPRPALNHNAVADFLTFLWVPDPNTLYQGISQLPAGHCATFRAGRLEVREYWDLRFEAGSALSWPEEVRTAVAQAVRRQMIADVPLGGFLSGGIDSSAIIAEMSAVQDTRVSTYTVGFTAEDLAHEIVPDDIRYARRISAEFGTDYHERILHPDIVDLLPRLIWHLDEPIADPATITTYLICSAARESLTVVLSGMGGDEVFAGYPRHLAAKIGRAADRLPRRLLAGAASMIERRGTMGRPGRLRGPRRNVMKLARGLADTPDGRYLTYCSYYRPDELPLVLGDELRAAIGDHDPFARHLGYLERVRGEHWLNRFLYLDMKTFLPCLNLAYTDRMSMATSTEVRVPLLDREVVALGAAIPPDLKLRGLRRKDVFKRSQEGILPKDVIRRPKAGFGAPLRSWLGGALRPMVDELLSPAAIRDRGLLNPAAVERIIAADRSGAEDNALRIWAFLTLELWQQVHLDPRVAPARPDIPVWSS